MSKPGHDRDCQCLSCNPWETSPWNTGSPPEVQCGGCARPIREVEEGVWVRTGSEECEAGGVHSPPRPAPAPLTEIYLMRSTEGKGWWTGSGWQHSVIHAMIFDPQIAKGTVPGSHPWEWVVLAESPF